MNAMTDQLGRQIMTFGPRGILGLALFVLFWIGGIVSGWLFRRIGRGLNQERREILKLAGATTKGALILLGTVTALGTMGINVSALVAGLGLTGFALGFALRDVLSNLLAGALILIYRPFRIEDRIAVAGSEGAVAEINLRYTVLQGEDKTFLIPNSVLLTNTITLQTPKGEVGGSVPRDPEPASNGDPSA